MNAMAKGVKGQRSKIKEYEIVSWIEHRCGGL